MLSDMRNTIDPIRTTRAFFFAIVPPISVDVIRIVIVSKAKNPTRDLIKLRVHLTKSATTMLRSMIFAKTMH
jgi:hypothetical protein